MSAKGILYEDLIKVHIRSSSQENKRRDDCETFLNDLRGDLVAWHPIWLHNNEMLMYGAGKTLLSLSIFGESKGIHRFEWFGNFDGSNHHSSWIFLHLR